MFFTNNGNILVPQLKPQQKPEVSEVEMRKLKFLRVAKR
jgi:hypothetical protein